MIASLLFTGMDFTDRYQWIPLTVVLLAISTVDYLTGLA